MALYYQFLLAKPPSTLPQHPHYSVFEYIEAPLEPKLQLLKKPILVAGFQYRIRGLARADL
jgi:hypothetical protein